METFKDMMKKRFGPESPVAPVPKKVTLKEGWKMADDGDLYRYDEDGRVFLYPTTGGCWLIETPEKYCHKQIAGTCDMPYRVALGKAKRK